MGMIKSFALVVVNLFGDLWLGMGRKPEFYDTHTNTKTRAGYVFFVAFAALLAIGAVTLLFLRMY
ncbi:hypothetical protein BK133_17910 [Paenibacillus sp. FSL H8-0548]|uniref:hypothetical protein n=1 Tax=Paenibacillus sp. FSL H8-0548 TaxID=1920422 RepID=UPI00096D69DC|nr:hypothetical protein [Paenibacillus sp. FSL H8-0548]OMF29411.1 hypothetical protein BK133_17910 [Paenibacillus sp. FSL H8-0548]